MCSLLAEEATRPESGPVPLEEDWMERWVEPYAKTCFHRSADTAHDLKTPLNIATLNLELLRMRVRKLVGRDDETVLGYARAIELELRRMGKIFDAFFVYSVPPKNANETFRPVDLASLASRMASEAELSIEGSSAAAIADLHEERARELLKLFFDGAVKLLKPGSVSLSATKDSSCYSLVLGGESAANDIELGRIFKFYYTDGSGNPDLTLATARLIAETCGGSVEAAEDAGRLTLELRVPLGEK